MTPANQLVGETEPLHVDQTLVQSPSGLGEFCPSSGWGGDAVTVHPILAGIEPLVRQPLSFGAAAVADLVHRLICGLLKRFTRQGIAFEGFPTA